MQERAYAKRGEQYLLIKSPPASGKSRALMFIALDKLNNQGLQQAIIVVPERSIGGSFADEPLSQYGFYWDWQVAPQWNLCNAPGIDEPRVAKSKVDAVRAQRELAAIQLADTSLNAPLNAPNPKTFYTKDEEGYTDYPFLKNKAA